MIDHDALPSYAELLRRTDAPPGSTWQLFGRDDQIGTLNFLSPDRVAAAAREVRRGQAYSLDLRSDVIAPSLAPTRQPLQHHIFQRNEFHRDEWLDRVYTQYGSQLDGLRHIGHPDYGFYNGNDPALFLPGTEPLGIHHLSALPIVGRGVATSSCSASAGSTTTAASPLPRRARLVSDQRHTGVLQSHEAVAWLWDHRISLAAADNFAFESWPPHEGSPFFSAEERANGTRGPHSGIMHRALIPLLGLPLGELWDLDALATDCAEEGRYTCLLTVAPLPVVGGVGSPANAIALR